MTEAQLAEELQRAIARGGDRGKATAVHLFGIAYADELRQVSIDDVIRRAGIEKSWGTEVRKGVKLAAHVTLKDHLD